MKKPLKRPPLSAAPEADAPLPPALAAALLAQPENTPRVTKSDVRAAAETLRRYKSGKARLEKRVVEDELWWKLRHWEVMRRGERARAGGPCGEGESPFAAAEPTSAWLFNAIAAKHADAMDNYPEPLVLPRESSDAPSAETLSEVLPVILENARFEQTYSDAWWEKLKHGTAVYGVFWNAEKENGLGDIDLRMIDLLNIFWEPGVSDIQRSKNVFVTELADNDALVRRYPQLEGKLGGDGGLDVSRYLYDDAVDTSEKSLVVDWYYKTRGLDGREKLHYAKFTGDELLYASENDPACRDAGFYAHGQYPFVFDTLFPEKGTPVGFGYVAVCKDPQMYIDRLFGSILSYALRAANPRWFLASSTGVNERELLDWSKPVVHVEGTLDDTRLRRLTMEPLSGIYTDVIRMKIDEMKETAANRDVSNGGPGGGVTAASAIAALQEAGNKLSRDMIAASYRAEALLASLVIELIRQFYDVTRAFRVTGPGGDFAFRSLSNAALREQPIAAGAAGETLYRRPCFDLKIAARKKNPYSLLEQNERARALYSAGFFDPARAQEALGALEMMDFERVDEVRDYVREGQTLEKLVREQAAVIEALRARIAATPAPGKRVDQGIDPYGAGGEAADPVGADALVRPPSPADPEAIPRAGLRAAAAATPHV